jgi:formylglycine-generating enzyme required for sulfatase activity
VEHEDGSITTNIVSVGSFRPNAYGLYDTLGNIQELTREDKNLLTDQQWNDGGEDLIGAVTALSGGDARDSSLVGGAFNTDLIGFTTRQVHGTSSTIATGFRVCMQSMADGIALIAPKTE